MNSLVLFACLGYKALFYNINDDELYIKTKTTCFADVAIRFTFLKNFPFYLERFLEFRTMRNSTVAINYR